MSTTETISQTLLTCLRHTPTVQPNPSLSQLSPTQWEQLITLADAHQVTVLLYHRLKAHGGEALTPPAVWQSLQKTYYKNVFRNIKLYQELREITTALDEQKIPTLILKGAHLAATVYESIALRSMVDIDIMVPPHELTKAVEQLKALGYQPSTPWLSLDAYLTYNHHVPPFVRPNTVTILELHWRITRPQRAYSIPMDELWQRSTPITANGVTLQGFCPEDLLLHVCMHATYHHWFQQGVRFLCDVTEIIHRYGDQLDWDAIVQRAVAWEWQRGVFLALAAAQQLLGAQIPADVLKSLNRDECITFQVDELHALLFPEHPELLHSPTEYFLDFLKTPHVSAKLRLFTERLFLSRQEMAVKYAVDPHSRRLYFYYLLRFRDLAARFTHKTWRMWFGDPAMRTVTGQQEKLQEWLEQS